MAEIVKLLVLAAIVLTPMFLFAHELSGDEFAKSSMGVAMAAIAYGAFKLLDAKQWK